MNACMTHAMSYQEQEHGIKVMIQTKHTISSNTWAADKFLPVGRLL